MFTDFLSSLYFLGSLDPISVRQSHCEIVAELMAIFGQTDKKYRALANKFWLQSVTVLNGP